MIRRRRVVIIVASAVIVALATVVLLVAPRTAHLVLIDDFSDTLLFSVRVNEPEEFSVSFMHSVNISPVTEIFQIKEGQIILYALEFYTFGAGTQAELEPGQTLTRLPEGGMRIDGFDRVIVGLRYSIGHDTEHTLQVGAQRVALDTLGAVGRPIRFDVEFWNLWQRVRTLI